MFGSKNWGGDGVQRWSDEREKHGHQADRLLEKFYVVVKGSVESTHKVPTSHTHTLFRRPYLTGRATIGRLELPPGEGRFVDPPLRAADCYGYGIMRYERENPPNPPGYRSRGLGPGGNYLNPGTIKHDTGRDVQKTRGGASRTHTTRFGDPVL